jgi:hypothetical protein
MSHHSIVIWFGVVLPLIASIIIWYKVRETIAWKRGKDFYGIKLLSSFAKGGWCFMLRIRHIAFVLGYNNRAFAKRCQSIGVKSKIGFYLFYFRF